MLHFITTHYSARSELETNMDPASRSLTARERVGVAVLLVYLGAIAFHVLMAVLAMAGVPWAADILMMLASDIGPIR